MNNNSAIETFYRFVAGFASRTSRQTVFFDTIDILPDGIPFMQRLQGKHIVLGVTGGIAAYKSAELVRLLSKEGAEIKVVMTRAACEFIRPLTFQALSCNPVHLDLLDTTAEAAMGHIELARWADIVLIAPATANVMAKLAGGMADDLLSTLCLATSAPISIAPAMNQRMWRNPAVQANLEKLKAYGMQVLGPAQGYQACGDMGPGRMLDPEEIVSLMAGAFSVQQPLAGKHIMITAGATREEIDPVRFISNHSSGKMGYQLASAAATLGARVTLVSGPVSLSTPIQVELINITSARQMLAAVHENIENVDIFIGCAAVSDYRPNVVQNNKIKKDPGMTDETLCLKLIRNPDIIASVTALDRSPFVVGFAAETQNVLSYAKDKLLRKRMDMIIANDVSVPGQGFCSDENAVTVLSREKDAAETVAEIARASKQEIAGQIMKHVCNRYRKWMNHHQSVEESTLLCSH
ncbi:Coenzyme A biosynthesis bifunctional protein CoaBC [invertebrate metagenome]|uniref:Coenzyme A biosynthesis bifunctional protein CoaBC n=1 Tax=invertebrate metagenome TaxID=1711999 RepID=A0A2H9TA12_9ZZZZ